MLFLPVSLVIYGISEFKSKKICLLIFSIAFLLLNNIYFASAILFLSCLVWITGRIISALKNKILRKSILILSVLVDIFILFAVHSEYWDMICSNYILFPFGISFFVIQSYLYLRDCCHDKIYFKAEFIDTLLYLIYFPKFLMGPVMTYDHFIAVLNKRKMTYRAIANGFSDYMVGFSFKIIIADSLYKMISSIIRNQMGNISISLAWFMAVAFFMYVYFIFYSYSKMADGISKMFGISIMKNTSPYVMCESLDEFQKSYNRSVMIFFDKSYSDISDSKAYLNFVKPVLIWISYGLWYGFNILSLVFGAIMGLFTAIENFFYKKKKHKPQIIRRIIIFIFLVVLFVFLMPCNVNETVEIYASMVGIGNDFYNDVTIYYFKEYLIIFIIAIVAIINEGKSYQNFIKKKNKNDEKYIGTIYSARLILFLCAIIMLIRENGCSPSQILL
jgi:alginate O-acetyltransferase complex protein AlgI